MSKKLVYVWSICNALNDWLPLSTRGVPIKYQPKRCEVIILSKTAKMVQLRMFVFSLVCTVISGKCYWIYFLDNILKISCFLSSSCGNTSPTSQLPNHRLRNWVTVVCEGHLRWRNGGPHWGQRVPWRETPKQRGLQGKIGIYKRQSSCYLEPKPWRQRPGSLQVRQSCWMHQVPCGSRGKNILWKY